jgi:hypothetical protein
MVYKLDLNKIASGQTLIKTASREDLSYRTPQNEMLCVSRTGRGAGDAVLVN